MPITKSVFVPVSTITSLLTGKLSTRNSPNERRFKDISQSYYFNYNCESLPDGKVLQHCT